MRSSEASKVFSSTRVVGLFMPSEIFRAKEKFRVSSGQEMPVKFNSVDDRFLCRFGLFSYGVEQQVVLLECHTLAGLTSTQDMLDGIGGLDDEDSFTTVPEAYALLLSHAEGKSNCALSTVHGNIFFLRGRHGLVWILNFIWCNNTGWMVTFCEGQIPHEWLKDTRVFSHHKLRRAV